MKLLHVLASLDPKDGGPREGVCRLGAHLTELGHSVTLLTLDGPDEPFLKQIPVTVIPLGPSRGKFRYNKKLVPWLRAHASNYDAVFVNGLWQYQGFGTRRALRAMGLPYFVFTHGMLDPWFKSEFPFKHLKKWLYWPWGEYRVLRDARNVLFTSEEEKSQARRSFWLYRVRERVVAYGTSPPPQKTDDAREKFLSLFPELRGCRILLFLGRIHHKKGCDLLIESFAKMSATEPSLRLMMAGPGEPGLVARLKRIAEDRGVAEHIVWPGMLQGEDKWTAFHCSEAFVLPSHQENFGIAVAEALACSLPVLISDKVNIWREIVADAAGLAEPDTQSGTDRLLNRWCQMSPEARMKMRGDARRCFDSHFRIEAMARDLLSVVRAAIP